MKSIPIVVMKLGSNVSCPPSPPGQRSRSGKCGRWRLGVRGARVGGAHLAEAHEEAGLADRAVPEQQDLDQRVVCGEGTSSWSANAGAGGGSSERLAEQPAGGREQQHRACGRTVASSSSPAAAGSGRRHDRRSQSSKRQRVGRSDTDVHSAAPAQRRSARARERAQADIWPSLPEA